MKINLATNLEQVIREYLPDIFHMSLGTCANNNPWVSEVHFAYDDDLNLYFRSLTSRRHSQEIAANPSVAGNIVTQHMPWDKVRGIYFEGTAELLTEHGDRITAFRCLHKRLEPSKDIWEDSEHPEGHQFYKITVEKFSVFDGRESTPSQKYELPWKTK